MEIIYTMIIDFSLWIILSMEIFTAIIEFYSNNENHSFEIQGRNTPALRAAYFGLYFKTMILTMLMLFSCFYECFESVRVKLQKMPYSY